MQERLLEFASLLRQNGVAVSTAETLDAVGAAAIVGPAERETLRAALRATMVKRSADLPAFEQLFDLYFSGLASLITEAARAVQSALGMSDIEFQRMLERVEELMRQRGMELSELTRRLLAGDSARLEQIIREAARAVRLEAIERAGEESQFARAMARRLGLERAAGEIEELRRLLAGFAADQDEERRLDEYLDRRLSALDEIIRRYTRIEREQRDLKSRELRGPVPIEEKSFYYLTEEEMERMRAAVTRLAERLKNVVALRRKSAKRGRLDPKRTLRSNLEYGAVPFRLCFDHRKKQKPQVVVLCDISDSVRNASRFMLQFVYQLQDLYSRVRSFVFVAEIGEVTDLFRHREAVQALEAALGGDVVNVYAHSNFGHAFQTFVKEQLQALNKRTTVIVLGDGRNNYNLPHDWCLRAIRERAERLVWLNPESRGTWAFGDSEMERYAPHCHVVEECRNLNQLYRVVERLVAR
jgi:uncharacterized protein